MFCNILGQVLGYRRINSFSLPEFGKVLEIDGGARNIKIKTRTEENVMRNTISNEKEWSLFGEMVDFRFGER